MIRNALTPVSTLMAALLVVVAVAVGYTNRPSLALAVASKTADACQLPQADGGEVYFVSCGGFF